MANVSVLDVKLHGQTIGTITNIGHDRSLFAFTDDYIANERRPVLSLSFKDSLGQLITDLPPTQTALPPFFSNLLPEGNLRRYLAERAGVKSAREFYLIWMLGKDLPGAITVEPAEGEALPPGTSDNDETEDERRNALRFSLAGVQLKFSALKNTGKHGGLTIPARGVGGSWIVKLPSMQFEGVPENEFSMMTIAAKMGMDVPEVQLMELDAVAGLPENLGEMHGQAMAVKRFDRGEDGPVHIEDFAQVFGAYPDEKYDKGNYRMIGRVLGIETGAAGVTEFVRRLIFSTLIGNGDMHLKNWSLIYPDRINAALSPAYDLVSTIPYIPNDPAALNYSRTKRMEQLDEDELAHFAAKAELNIKLVMDVTRDTVDRFTQVWQAEKANLPMAKKVVDAIDEHVTRLPIAKLKA
jgi:serine/threonine-protein kinase HipA